MISEDSSLFRYYYGMVEHNKTVLFYNLVRAKTSPQSRVLNLGAGPATQNPTCVVKGEVAEVVGADIDPVVLENDELDDAVVIENDRLPFPDAHFDIAFSDYVLEHVVEPYVFLSEVLRVIRPGGIFFFRTPNNYHYVSLIARMTPHRFHTLVANRVRGMPEEAHEPWPTFHRLNTRHAIREAAGTAGFREIRLRMVEGHPSYLMFHSIPFLLGTAYERIVNSTELLAGLRANIFGELVR